MAQKRVDIILAAKDRASTVVGLLGTSITRLNRSLFNLRTAAVGVAFGLAVKQGAEFEQSMARVRAITGATDAQFEKLTKTAKDLGSTTVFSASQSAEAMAAFSLAGFRIDQTIAAMLPTLNLAAAGQLEIGQAADIAAKIMAGMAIEAEDLGQTVDVLTKAFTTANTDLPMLGEAMEKVGPIAKTVEKDLGEVVAAIQVLSNAGIQGEQAGTQLRNILIALADPTKVQMLEQLGISALDATGRIRPLSEIVAQFERQLSSIGSGEQLGLLNAIFGKRTAGAAAELIAQGSAELARLEKQLKDVGGTSERVADVQLDTLSGSITLLKSAVEGVNIAFTEMASDTLRSVVSGATSAANGLKGLLTAISSVDADTLRAVKTTTALVAAFAVALPLTLKLGSAIVIAGAALKTMTAAAIAANVAVGITSINFTGAGIAALIASTKVTIFNATLAATKVAAIALQATLIGALAAGVAVVATAFIRAKVEGISFGDAILRIADDLGLIDSKTIGVQRAQDALADASKAAKEAQEDLDQADAAESKLAANEALITALERQIKARKDLEKAENRLFGEDISAGGLQNDPFTVRLERALAAARERAAELSDEIADSVPDANDLGDAIDGINASVAKTLEALELQAATMHMSSIEADLYRLRIEGATDAQLEQARALLETIEARRKEVDLIEEGVRLAQQHVSEEERINKQVRAIEAARKAGRISEEQATRATEAVLQRLQQTVSSIDFSTGGSLGAQQSRFLQGLNLTSTEDRLAREGVRIQVSQDRRLAEIAEELKRIRQDRRFNEGTIIVGAGI